MDSALLVDFFWPSEVSGWVGERRVLNTLSCSDRDGTKRAVECSCVSQVVSSVQLPSGS